MRVYLLLVLTVLTNACSGANDPENPRLDCDFIPLDEFGTEWEIRAPDVPDASCFYAVSNGISVRVFQGGAVRILPPGEDPEVTPTRVSLLAGIAQVKTPGLPIEVEHHGHVVRPREWVQVGEQHELTSVLALKSGADFSACERSECVVRTYELTEGEYLAVLPDGHWYARQGADSRLTYAESGGCSLGGSQPPAGVLGFILLMFWLVSRRKFQHL